MEMLTLRITAISVIFALGAILSVSLRCGNTVQQPAETPKQGDIELAKATFAAGCFWGVEETFRKLDGVVDTTVGFTGGSTENPTYEEVCRKDTGHAEAVLVEYDPDKLSYEELLDVFWDSHDPTTRNRQGPDVGSQYRSAIFYHNEEQGKFARESKDKLDQSGTYEKPIVTEIEPAGPFYRAEEYHQQYYQKRGGGSCPAR